MENMDSGWRMVGVESDVVICHWRGECHLAYNFILDTIGFWACLGKTCKVQGRRFERLRPGTCSTYNISLLKGNQDMLIQIHPEKQQKTSKHCEKIPEKCEKPPGCLPALRAVPCRGSSGTATLRGAGASGEARGGGSRDSGAWLGRMGNGKAMEIPGLVGGLVAINFIFPLISINIGNLIIPIDEVIFFRGVGIQPPTSHEKLRCFPSVSTLRGSYGRCKGRCFIRVLTLVSSFSPVNFGLQWLVWNVEVHFGRTGLHKVWSRRSCHETSYRDL